MARSTYDDFRVMAEFDTALRACTLRTHPKACGREYIHIEKLLDWWKGPAIAAKEATTQVAHMLRYAYRNNRNYQLLNPEGFQVLPNGERSFIIIFSILCEMRCENLIHHFLEETADDRHLPFDEGVVHKYFRAMAQDGIINMNDSGALARVFFERQWKYCAVKIGEDYQNFKRQSIVPIHFKEVISEKGGTAVLWRIVILKDFVHKTLHSDAREYVPPDNDDDGHGPRYDFAMKVYRGQGAKRHCSNERAAFRALQEHAGIVRFYGSFTQESSGPTDNEGLRSQSSDTVKQESGKIYHLLLEWGTRDLIQFFQSEFPPFLPDEIEKFWLNLFALAKTLKGIHHCQITREGVKKSYSGFHCDVKPENILEIGGAYKLADPGFADFYQLVDGRVMDVPVQNIKGSTHTYGAPELRANRSGTVNQLIDIWSLGCIFSVAATWIAFGSYQGVQQYSTYRRQVQSKLMSRRSASERATTTTSDSFHDEKAVLPEIARWHTFLKTTLRRTDTITAAVLDVVDEFMLVSSNTRIPAARLCDELSKIRTAPDDSNTVVDTDIVTFLREEDAKIPEPSTSSTSTIIPSGSISYSTFEKRQNAKISLEKAPIKPTAHRALRTATSNASSRPVPVDSKHKQSITQLAIRRMTDQLSSHAMPEQEQLSLSVHDSSQSPLYNASIHERQTVDEAYAMSQNGKSKKRALTLKTFLHSRKPTEKQNAFLASYYSNRDIIFLVDNAQSMLVHWPRVRKTVQILLEKVDGLDKDGVDLYLTRGGKRELSKNEYDSIMNELATEPQRGMFTDVTGCLHEVFEDYGRERRKASRRDVKQKKLTLLFLTDGQWNKPNEGTAVASAIEDFVKVLRKDTSNHDKHSVGIEFIQFGEDPRVTELLQWLDDGVEAIAQIVDTDPATGDVYKMLLGSFVDAYDQSDTHSITESNFSSISQESNSTAIPEEMKFPSDYMTAHASGGAIRY